MRLRSPVQGVITRNVESLPFKGSQIPPRSSAQRGTRLGNESGTVLLPCKLVNGFFSSLPAQPRRLLFEAAGKVIPRRRNGTV